MIRRTLLIVSGALALGWIALAVTCYVLACFRGQWGAYTLPLFKPTGQEVTEVGADGELWTVRDEQGAFMTWSVDSNWSHYVPLYSPGIYVERSSWPRFSMTVFVPTHLPMSQDRPGGWLLPYAMSYYVMSGQLAIGICFWFPITVFSIAPLIWFARRLFRRRMQSQKLCAKCSYNLTGNLSGVCPECGTPVPKQSA
jgi:hypothetical protein